MSSVSPWSYGEIARLIEAVKQREPLYNPMCVENRSRASKSGYWKEVAAAVGGKNVLQCKERWGILRGLYRRQQRIIAISNKPKKFRDPWRWASRMSFMGKFFNIEIPGCQSPPLEDHSSVQHFPSPPLPIPPEAEKDPLASPSTITPPPLPHTSKIASTPLNHLSTIAPTRSPHPIRITHTPLSHPSAIAPTPLPHPSTIAPTSLPHPSTIAPTSLPHPSTIAPSPLPHPSTIAPTPPPHSSTIAPTPLHHTSTIAPTPLPQPSTIAPTPLHHPSTIAPTPLPHPSTIAHTPLPQPSLWVTSVQPPIPTDFEEDRKTTPRQKRGTDEKREMVNEIRAYIRMKRSNEEIDPFFVSVTRDMMKLNDRDKSLFKIRVQTLLHDFIYKCE